MTKEATTIVDGAGDAATIEARVNKSALKSKTLWYDRENARRKNAGDCRY